MADGVAIRCTALGVPVTGRQLVGLVILPLVDPETARPLAAQDRMRDLAELTAAAARSLGDPALVGVVDDGVVQVLLSLPHRASVGSRVDRFANAVHRATSSAPRPISVLVAAGSPVADLAAAAQTLIEARHVADAARRSDAARPCHRLDDVRLRGLLHLLADDRRLAAFTDRELGPLEAYDAAHGTNLMEVLRAATSQGANKTAAAASLHLSRAAYYERLARVERILGVNLADPESRTSLHVALLARAIGAHEPPPQLRVWPR
jgi:PucR family transcriptional regulator, purine catabolism regulatory protein